MNEFRIERLYRKWRLPVIRLFVSPEPEEVAAAPGAQPAVTVVHYHLHVHPGADLSAIVPAFPPGAVVTAEEGL